MFNLPRIPFMGPSYREQEIVSEGKIERVFRIVKIQFGFSKVVYRGLAKNLNRLFGLFMSANAYMLAKSGRLVSL